MSDYNESKKNESLKIPERKQIKENGAAGASSKPSEDFISSLSNGVFYEIEYDSGPVAGVGRFVTKPKPERIEAPEKDEKRELFGQMRDIARAHRSAYDYSKFFDRRVQNNDSAIFYQQGMFMKDFTDNYANNTPFSQYFPYYQMMGYEQLRTYFTWRTQVRSGNVADTSLSYAFLYIYELLGNIGVSDPQDGLDKLMSFWKSFSEHNNSIDKYMLRWIKDYHIYYELPHSFKEFIENNNLVEHYPDFTEPDDDFDFFCAISKYNIKKSSFFTPETSKMISECFSFVMDRIRHDFEASGMIFDDALFRPAKKIVVWKPFKNALFHPWLKQPDRQVVFSENEIYRHKNNQWTFSTVITSEKGRQFIGYVMKQMESMLRKITKYKYKLTANIGMVNADTIRILTKAGLFIEKIVPAAVIAYYRESTKTVISVDHTSLARIRQEALATQESLIVEDQTQTNATPPLTQLFSAQDQNIFADQAEPESAPGSDIWSDLKYILSETELRALSVIFQGNDIKGFADECGAMLEVLIDGINEKAMDYIGDNLIDDDFVLYDDYKESVRELIK